MSQNENTENFNPPLPSGSKSMVESYVFDVESLNGKKGFDAFVTILSATGKANVLIGSIVGLNGNPKYPVDERGIFLNPMLKEVFNNLKEEKLLEKVNGDIYKEGVSVRVGNKFSMRGSRDTAEVITDKATEYAFNIATMRAFTELFKINYILGVDGVIPPNIQLSDIGMALGIEQVVNMCLSVHELAQELKEKEESYGERVRLSEGKGS